MGLLKLPNDILYLIVREIAFSDKENAQKNLASFSTTCQKLHAVYSLHAPLLYKRILVDITGPYYKIALLLAWIEHRENLEPKYDILESFSVLDLNDKLKLAELEKRTGIVRTAITNHILLKRFARYLRSRDIFNMGTSLRIALKDTPDDEITTLSPRKQPFTLVEWLRAAYFYAMQGVPPLMSPVHSLPAPPTAYLDSYLNLGIQRLYPDLFSVGRGSMADEVKELLVWRPGRWKTVGRIMGVWEEGGLEAWEVSGKDSKRTRYQKLKAFEDWMGSSKRRQVRLQVFERWLRKRLMTHKNAFFV